MGGTDVLAAVAAKVDGAVDARNGNGNMVAKVGDFVGGLVGIGG